MELLINARGAHQNQLRTEGPRLLCSCIEVVKVVRTMCDTSQSSD